LACFGMTAPTTNPFRLCTKTISSRHPHPPKVLVNITPTTTTTAATITITTVRRNDCATTTTTTANGGDPWRLRHKTNRIIITTARTPRCCCIPIWNTPRRRYPNIWNPPPTHPNFPPTNIRSRRVPTNKVAGAFAAVVVIVCPRGCNGVRCGFKCRFWPDFFCSWLARRLVWWRRGCSNSNNNGKNHRTRWHPSNSFRICPRRPRRHPPPCTTRKYIQHGLCGHWNIQYVYMLLSGWMDGWTN